MTEWKQIKEYLLSPECRYIHKIVWRGYAYLTEPNGTRHMIRDSMSLDFVKRYVRNVFKRQIKNTVFPNKQNYDVPD